MPLEGFTTILHINRETFANLFQLYWKRMYAFAVKTVDNEDDAKEIVQDVYKSLWERRKELHLHDAERYLLRSVKLKSLEYLRNKDSKQRHHDVILYRALTYYEEETIHYKELKHQVNTAIESLPRQCKNVFKMSREEGLTNKEIAKILLITERAVEYHISKALSVIKIAVTEHCNTNTTKTN